MKAQPCKSRPMSRMMGCANDARSVCLIQDTIVAESSSMIKKFKWRIWRAYLIPTQAAYNSVSGTEESRRDNPPAARNPRRESWITKAAPPAYPKTPILA